MGITFCFECTAIAINRNAIEAVNAETFVFGVIFKVN